MMKNLCVYLQTASPNFNLHPPPSPLAPVYGEKLNLFLQRLLISKHNLRSPETYKYCSCSSQYNTTTLALLRVIQHFLFCKKEKYGNILNSKHCFGAMGEITKKTSKFR